ncbi:MAG: diacylglycerol kinase family protein [Ruminiclostridium sp.]|nr:diacylglycerol kinase family protein [Ruminiclostridium sp.]
MKKRSGVLKSFYFAGRGIAFCLRHERHLRIHLVMTAYVMYFSTFYNFTKTDYGVLILTCAAVISMEIINTAVEVVIDKVSPKYNIFAMIGKDIAAGAVLFSAVGAIAVGIFMFWDPAAFVRIFEYFTSDFIKPLILLATLVASVLFIMHAKPRKLGHKRTDKGKEIKDD